MQYVLSGLQNGFSLEYKGEHKFQAPRNLPSAFQFPDAIRERLYKEITLGRMAGLFDSPPLPNLMCSPVGMVPKKDSDEMCMIMHLSFPYGNSINDFIDQEKASIKYQHFDDAINLVVTQGRFCWLAKGDVKSAFKLAPIRYQDLECLGIYFENQFFVDLTLPFGSAISCAIFKEISTLVHWIFERQTQVPFVHYLDDYLWGHINKMHCQLAFDTVQSTAQDIGLLLSPEKLVPPTQFIHFLGLGIDTVKWLVVVLEDKRADIVNMLEMTMAAKKVTVKHLQSLAGKLNFITRAIPQGWAFSARIYQEFKDLRLKWHILVTKELRKDLQMWLCFLQHFGGCSPILVPSSPVVEIYMDASTNPNLGWGCGPVNNGCGMGGNLSSWLPFNHQLIFWRCMQLY